jgi:uncharacterized membrane protein YfcA
MDFGMMGQVVTFCVFGAVGWLVARRRKQRVGARMWVLLAVGVIVGSSIGVGTRLVSVFEFAMYLNWAIAAFCFGALLEFVLHPRPSEGTSEPDPRESGPLS